MRYTLTQTMFCLIAAVNDESGGDRRLVDVGRSDSEKTDSSLVGMD